MTERERDDMMNINSINRMATAFILAGVLVVAMATQSQAVSYGFYSLTGDSQAADLLVDVTETAGGDVSFMFTNDVSDGSAIAQIYFDFGSMLGGLTDPTWTSHADTAFVEGASPANLPGGQDPGVGFYSDYGLNRKQQGGMKNALHAGEWLDVVWTLSAGATFSDVIAALDSGDMRVGLHVQSVGPDGELSFAAVTPTPVPGAVWLFGTGLVGLVGLRRFRV